MLFLLPVLTSESGRKMRSLWEAFISPYVSLAFVIASGLLKNLEAAFGDILLFDAARPLAATVDYMLYFMVGVIGGGCRDCGHEGCVGHQGDFPK